MNGQKSKCFERASIRRALKKWHKLGELGQHNLADLKMVQAARQKGGYPDTPRGYGTALREVLGQAIQKLKPNGEPPYPLNQRWGPYIILTEQYTNMPPRRRKEVQQIWGIAPGTFPAWQRTGLDYVGDLLSLWKQNDSAQTRQVPFMVPPQADYTLIGRTQLLADLKKRLFAAQSVALSALNRLPGVGKTALAITLAHDADVRAHFSDGVLWVGLGRQPHILTLLTVWGMALGIPASEMAQFSTIEDRAKVIHTAIGERKMLLVIDDAWQIKDTLAFRLGGPNCVHLLTTRQPEVAWEFAQQGASKIKELNEHDSLTLLSRFVPQLVRAHREEVLDVVKEVGGLPLALILIGRYLQKSLHFGKQSTLPDFLRLYQNTVVRLKRTICQERLTKPPRLPLGVPLSLLASIEISDSALHQPARQMLRALSSFPPKPNSFSEEAALALSKLPAKTLHTLTGAGLLEPSGPDRYTMHQAIADYVRFKNPEPDPYYRNGARHVAEFAQQNSMPIGGELVEFAPRLLVQEAQTGMFTEGTFPWLIEQIPDNRINH